MGICWDVLKDCGMKYDMYTTGSDAGLVGGVTTEVQVNEQGKKEQVSETKVCWWHKALNFDEGSIIPCKHSQDTIVFTITVTLSV